ncbi:MAG TPA: bacillithiol system redox-active protein YtxJ [Saprospiraceae bacterium]|nr:bacillithiol system redox-active protein YtxJ [Saprospiraceae bacterium]HNG89049.1 bacillithiol system redox-active protein YtxJ [Saprospiraceae bacterium]
MSHWNSLTTIDQVDALVQRSQELPCLIFKHSTRCNISSLAKFRLDDDWGFAPEQIEAYYLDLLAHRPVSNYVAETFGIHHESPQALLIVGGECVYDASHLDISVAELKEALSSVAV